MEKDDEIKGGNNSNDFGERMYDNRIARFTSLDRFKEKFTYNTPYGYANNTPIQAIDKAGDSVYYKVKYVLNKVYVKIVVDGAVINLSNDKTFKTHKLVTQINEESKDITFLGQTVKNLKILGHNGKELNLSEAEVSLEFNFRKVNKMSDINDSDHLIVVGSTKKTQYNRVDKKMYKLANGLASYKGKIAYVDSENGSGSKGATVALHEVITHNLGLTHGNNPLTITYGKGVGWYSGNISDSNLQDIITNIDSGLLNQGSNTKNNFGFKSPESKINTETGTTNSTQVFQDTTVPARDKQ